MIDINKLEYSNFSQNGEDGIIEYLVENIKNNDKFFVEIGCGNGLENNSTNLVLNDWSGIVLDIENNIKQYRKLLKIINPNKKITTISSYLNLSNVNKVIDIKKKNKIIFFSLDIDSFDFYILNEIFKYNIFPIIISLEYNAFLGHDPITVKYFPNFNRKIFDKNKGLYFGASLNAWKTLLKKYNYDFIGVDKNGVNCFFVLSNNLKFDVKKINGLQFEYTRFFVNKYKVSGEILQKELLNQFHNEFININTLI